MSSPDSTTERDTRKHTAGAFDIRTLIATLLVIYGVILLLVGVFGNTDHNKAKTDDVNLNLWAGIGLVVVAAAMQTWAYLRPVIVPDDPDDA